MLIDVTGLPMLALAGLMLAAGVIVWAAGVRLTRYVNALSHKTPLSHAFSGMLLLGGITSLPEVATVSTASAIGNAPMAMNNLLGTASVNVLLLALGDIIYGRGALTAVAAKPATLMQGILSILLMMLVAAIAIVGDLDVLGVGVASAALVTACFLALRLSSAFGQRHVWAIVDQDMGEDADGDTDRDEEGRAQPRAQAAAASGREGTAPGSAAEGAGTRRFADWSVRRLVLFIALAAAFILVGGYVLAMSGDALAKRTGIGASMVGFTLLALATSLPELSSITTALRLGQYEMAVGDIFGTNIFNIALLFLADVFYAGGPVLNEAGEFEVLGALLAALMSSVFLIGLLARRSASLLRMGYDSVVAIILFAAGLVGLSRLGG